MKLLDLFCGAGGCAMGYWRAGYHDITGIDIKPQKNYPFYFIQDDVFEWCAHNDLSQYDLIHASPPCQRFSIMTPPEHKDRHPDYIDHTRQLLKGKRYVIENVKGAPMKNAVMLCGTMFGLNIERHRYFECNPEIVFPPVSCNHKPRPVLITGTSKRKENGVRVGENTVQECRDASGIFWMTRSELDEAIPPAYTEWIGKEICKLITKSG